MDWSLFAKFAAPLTTALILFFLNKYFYNRPKLVAYYSHISAHRVPSNNGYFINIMTIGIEPNKEQLDKQYSDKLPMLLKNGNDVLIYGSDLDGNTLLVKSSNPAVYNSIVFTGNIVCLKEVPPEIYSDISANMAHISSMYIGTHALVVRNVGKVSAKNVRLGHKRLPDYNVFPVTKYEVTVLPGGGKEISFPTLVPGEQITISYLYFSPTVCSQVNTHVKSDEGLAKIIDVIPAPNLPMWQKVLFWILLFLGTSTVIYFAILLVVSFFDRLSYL